jgi:hypothetical protein
MSAINGGYIGVDRRFAKGGCHGIYKHILERRQNRFKGPRATIAPPAGSDAFVIDIFDTETNILARTGDAVGVIAFGTDTYDLYVYDGTAWQIYKNS